MNESEYMKEARRLAEKYDDTHSDRAAMNEPKQADDVRTVEGLIGDLEYAVLARAKGMPGSAEKLSEAKQAIRDAAATQAQQGESPSWKLVPIFPTRAMLDAAEQKFATAKASIIGFNARELAYKAMLDAAPTPSAPARQAVRMLTEKEAKDCMEWTLLMSEVEAIQRKFCEVNGIALPLEQQEGGE